MTGQFLNVGVEVFFLISGFLFGMRKINIKYIEWYKKRFKRILPSFYVFLVVLLCVYLIVDVKLDISRWLIYIFCLQGTGLYLYGAEHLWFLTVLLMCYLITPIMDWLRVNSSRNRNVILYVCFILVQLLCTYFISEKLGTYLLKINIYVIGYVLGKSTYKCDKLYQFVLAMALGIVGVVVRLIGKVLIDGTVTYNVMVAGITHSMIALAMLLMFQYMFHKEPGRIVRFLDGISYEVYLVHYMFIVGPVSLMTVTDTYVVNCAIVIVASMIAAYGIHKISEIGMNRKVN